MEFLADRIEALESSLSGIEETMLTPDITLKLDQLEKQYNQCLTPLQREFISTCFLLSLFILGLFLYFLRFIFIDEELQDLITFIEQDPLEVQILTSIYADQSKLQEISQLAENIRTLESELDSSNLNKLLKLESQSKLAYQASETIQKECKDMEITVSKLLNDHTSYVCTLSTHSSCSSSSSSSIDNSS